MVLDLMGKGTNEIYCSDIAYNDSPAHFPDINGISTPIGRELC